MYRNTGPTRPVTLYKFRIAPNSKVKLDLSNLPANYDLLVYQDIEAAYQELAQ